MVKHPSLRAKRSNLILHGRDCFVTEFTLMKEVFLAMTLCILFSACGPKKKSIPIPANILPKEKMARVLTDIHLAQAEVNLHVLPDTTKKMPINFQKVFEKDTISKKQYEESLTFYIDHPEVLNEVYQEVVNELSKMQGSTK